MKETAANILAVTTEAEKELPVVASSISTVILLPNTTASTQQMGTSAAAAGTKRRGRPPGPRKTAGKQKTLGGSARKRILSIVQASPGRQTATLSNGVRTKPPTPSPAPGQQGLPPLSVLKTASKTPSFHIPGSPLP